MNLRSTIVLLLIVMALQGCTHHSSKRQPTVNISPQSQAAAALLQQHKSWEGTPYKFGGATRSGIDCSAFTQITYLQKFKTNLPRTTSDQLTTGHFIKKDQLTAGDLVFFKTGGNKQRHVGIYVEQGVFLHASTSRGVTLSRLDNPYWHKHYWQAVRPIK